MQTLLPFSLNSRPSHRYCEYVVPVTNASESMTWNPCLYTEIKMEFRPDATISCCCYLGVLIFAFNFAIIDFVDCGWVMLAAVISLANSLWRWKGAFIKRRHAAYMWTGYDAVTNSGIPRCIVLATSTGTRSVLVHLAVCAFDKSHLNLIRVNKGSYRNFIIGLYVVDGVETAALQSLHDSVDKMDVK